MLIIVKVVTLSNKLRYFVDGYVIIDLGRTYKTIGQPQQKFLPQTKHQRCERKKICPKGKSLAKQAVKHQRCVSNNFAYKGKTSSQAPTVRKKKILPVRVKQTIKHQRCASLSQRVG